jgi:peptidoglycan L-alanyl-D-glutamate endopeptidase CwlK
MAKLGKSSQAQLDTCHPDLQRLMREVVARLPYPYDLRVTDGHRGEKAQNAAFAAGRSSKEWPYSKHNELPSRAVEVAAYPINYDDVKRQAFLAGFIKAVAVDLGISIRWGGDWDSDSLTTDQKLQDLPHFELA